MHSLRRQRFIIECAAIAALYIGLASSAAHAEFYVWGTSQSPQTVGSTPQTLQINGPTVTNSIMDLNPRDPTTLVITFSAECSVSGTGLVSYADIDIQVKKPGSGVFVTVPPTNDDDVFCASNGSAAHDGRITASRTVADTVPGGRSELRVVARTVGGAGTSRFDDLALLVER